MTSTARGPKQSDVVNGLASPPPPNNRDASGSNNKRWTQDRTPIQIPTNERRASIASGPFGASRTQSTFRNPIASRTLLAATRDPTARPPIKKRKVAHNNGGVKLGPDPMDPIEISDDEEDLGKKVERPSFSDLSKVMQYSIRGAAEEAKVIDAGRKTLSNIARPPSLPGPSSVGMKAFIDSGTNNEVEEIDSFSDDPITAKDLNGRHTGNVKEKIRQYENNESSVPRLDLYRLNMGKRNGLKKDGIKTKDAMKGKSSRIPPTRNAAQVNLNANNRPKSNNRAKYTVKLPLLEAYVGRRKYNESTLLWNSEDGTMKVEDNKLPLPRHDHPALDVKDFNL
ncbi:hypothetical protein BDZ89DRAFT_250726 [Hymenopellis radicata]|nr:hypothetical protein BDZ89DRAFT_250726 [Hymenopellis radicata]